MFSQKPIQSLAELRRAYDRRLFEIEQEHLQKRRDLEVWFVTEQVILKRERQETKKAKVTK